MKRLITLRRINSELTGILFVLAFYIIAWPFLPGLTWWIRHDAPVLASITTPRISQEIPVEDTLIINSLGLKEKIYEGESVYTVNQGVWRRPNTSTPDRGGNTVLVGHRFTYSGQSVFYNLDKIKQDDEITVYWKSKPYSYRVYEISVVPPTATYVEQPTSDEILTLYTCAPLLTARDRLVIKAKLL